MPQYPVPSGIFQQIPIQNGEPISDFACDFLDRKYRWRFFRREKNGPQYNYESYEPSPSTFTPLQSITSYEPSPSYESSFANHC